MGVLRLVPRDAPQLDLVPRLDDQALVSAVKAGDDSVASAFCARVWPAVSRTIGRLLGSRDADSDDVGQLALIELVTTIGRYRGECSLDAWAQTITAHVVFKHIRRRRLERRIFTYHYLTSLMAEKARVNGNSRRQLETKKPAAQSDDF